MERRELLAASAAVLVLSPLATLEVRAQATGTTPPPPANPPAAPPANAPAPSSGGGTDNTPKLTNAQIDQLVAPIALYPDGLLAQVLMAASYPLEVVEAARWVKDNPSLKGDAAVTAAKSQNWDVSVTSLVAFPQVLAMMNSKLDWTMKLGDAMVAQQSDVSGSVQRLRAQAQTAGNLKSTPQQKVTSQPPSAGAPPGTPQAIVIEPADPKTVYVPYYDPNQAYGSWPYSAYPPTYFPPPPDYGWVPGLLGGLAFGVGIGVGFGFFGGWAWGGGWGGGWGWGGWGGWGGGNTYVNVNNNVNHINNNYNHNPDHHWHHDPNHNHGWNRHGHNPHRPNDPHAHDGFRGHDRTSGLRGAGQQPRTADREREQREQAANRERQQQRANQERQQRENRGQEHEGYNDRGRATSGVNHGRQVQHEASRGRNYSQAHRSRPAPRHTSFHGGGGHPHGGRR
jgi:hypothetical protein